MLHLIKRCLLLPVVLVVGSTVAQPSAKNGVLDARLFDFSGHRLALNGVWGWYDNDLLTPEQTTGKPAWVAFPQTWNNARLSRSGQGVATYTLLVQLPAEQQNYGIELPQIYSSYRLWANGKLIAENGVPGISEAFTQPQWMPQTVYFAARDSMRLTLQIANFHHHKGGCKDPIFIGTEATMRTKESIAMTSKLTECGLLMLLALVFLAIYWAYGRKKVIIYFSLLCATWAVRSMFSNDYTFISLVPDFDWTTMVRIEYITLYLTMIWAILFLGRLFANDGSQIVKYVLVTLNGIFVAFTVLNPLCTLPKCWLCTCLLRACCCFTVPSLWCVRSSTSGQVPPFSRCPRCLPLLSSATISSPTRGGFPTTPSFSAQAISSFFY